MNRVEWKEKRVQLSSAIIVGAILMVLGIFVGANWNSFMAGMGATLTGQTYSQVDWSPLDEVYNKLANTYNGEVTVAEIIEGAKTGMVERLGDQYTVYMDATTSSDFYDDLHGNVGAGIGVEMGSRDGYVKVLRTLPDNPARRAGILAGDIFYKVDGEEVWKKSSSEIAKILHGEEGSEVTISMVRDGEELEFTMTREVINNVSEYVEYDGSTAIVTITRFDNDTGKKVQAEAAEFASRGVDKVILDLRGNGGGYVSAAQDLLALWLSGEEVYLQKSLHYDDSAFSTASGKAILSDMKTVVLVNGSTASASEITVGALKDYGKATIVGEKTYGKGVVQSLFTLSNGSTLKVTTADWYTPKGLTINGEGITPDIEVTRSYDDINKMRDPQMDKAKEL